MLREMIVGVMLIALVNCISPRDSSPLNCSVMESRITLYEDRRVPNIREVILELCRLSEMFRLRHWDDIRKLWPYLGCKRFIILGNQ